MNRTFEIVWKTANGEICIQEFENCEDEADAVLEWSDMWDIDPETLESVKIRELENEK